MKHRHAFFIKDTNTPGQGTFEIVNGKTGQPPALQIRQLKAAREWKSTIDIKDLNQNVCIPLEKS